MTVNVKFQCDGCFVEADGTEPIRKEFRSLSGRLWGFGSYHFTGTPTSVAPEGWVPFDPYTHACYCPDCWAEITEDDDAE